MERVILKGLKPESYEHVWDVNAKKILKTIPMFSSAVKKFNETFSDKVIIMEHKASYLEINSRQYSRIYDIFTDCCRILDVKQPPLFLVRSPQINAYTMGVANPLICITSECVEFLSEDELRFIFGHELGHIKSEHILYKSLASYLQMGGNEILIGAFPIGGVVAVIALNSALYKWSRMSEYTADRAGLLCVQDLDTSISSLAKLAGFVNVADETFNTEEFINQAERFNEQYQEGPDSLMANVRIMLGNYTHPYTVSRVYELIDWCKKGSCYKLIQSLGIDKLVANDDSTIEEFQKCGNCGKEIPVGNYYCPHCGKSTDRLNKLM